MGNGGGRNANATSITLSVPAGIQANDLLLMTFTINNGSFTVMPPSGWTALSVDSPAAGHKAFTYYKFAGASEIDAVVNFSSSVAATGVISSYRNVKALNTTGANSYVNTTQSAINPPDVTMSKSRVLAVLLNTLSTALAQTQPLSFAEAYDVALGVQSVESSYWYLHNKTSLLGTEMVTQVGTSSAYATSRVVGLEPFVNNPPTLTLTNPTNNQILSEGSSFYWDDHTMKNNKCLVKINSDNRQIFK